MNLVEQRDRMLESSPSDNPMQTTLYDFQQTLVNETMAALQKYNSVLIQAPTGSGKTEMAVDIVRQTAGLIWFVCHRREILHQTSNALIRTGLSDHGVIAPGYMENPAIRVQVCSIDALRHRHDRLPPPDFIVLDECHHIAAPSWAALIENFPKAKLLGLTATPARLDGLGLGQWFEFMVKGPPTRDLIAEGFLSAYRMFAPSIPDLRGIAIKRGDYDQAALEKAMDNVLVGDVIDHYKRLAPDARALAFCVSRKASRALVKRFREAGIPAAHVDWSTPKTKRDLAIADLASGQIRVLSNVNVFSEGFDLPAIDAVLLLRPTKSLAMYRQMVGRCLRVAPGKKWTIILDHAGLFFEHDMPDADIEWSVETEIAGTANPHTGGNERYNRCPECSAVHERMPVCPECGYIYQTRDRTIEEIYGELVELNTQQFNPAEYENRHRFEIRTEATPEKVRQWIKRGLPVYGPRNLIKIEEGLAWVKKNIGLPGDFESQASFARRIGIGRGTVAQLIMKGLPIERKSHWILIEAARRWLKHMDLLTDEGKYKSKKGKDISSKSRSGRRARQAQQPVTDPTVAQRNREINTFYANGATLRETGQKFGISGERVRQILGKEERRAP